MATTYEYKSLITGQSITLDERLSEEEMKERSLKRVWSVGFQLKSTDWGH